MSRYLPTVQLWKPEIAEAFYAGQLTLQPGQWIQCNRDQKPSRFAYAQTAEDGRVVFVRAYHWPRHSAYLDMVADHRAMAERQAANRAKRLENAKATLHRVSALVAGSRNIQL